MRELPDHLVIAFGELGVKEVAGKKHDARVLGYHAATKLKSTRDEVPWCSAFVCACLERTGVESTKSAKAKSFLTWGRAIQEPEIGCIAVFNRKGGGHVGFFLSENDSQVYVLGGNQGNQVCVRAYPKKELLGYRSFDKKPGV